MLKKLFFSEEKDICPNCGETCAITDVLCPQCGKNLDELFEQLPDFVTTPCTLLGSITTLRTWGIGVINRNWKKALLALAVLSGLVISGYAISYFHKAAVLAKLLNPKLAVVGEIADPEEYMVYNAIISPLPSSTELVVIENQTGFGLLDATDVRKDRKPRSFKISDEMWNDFITKNGSPSKLGNAFTLSTSYVLFDPTDMVDMSLELSGANINYTAFLEFSRVGFNSQKDEAIVHLGIEVLSRNKGPTFANGHYIWLKKMDGVWKIEKVQETYIT